MKKAIIGLFAMTSLVLTSCDMDVKDTTEKRPFLGFNLVNPLDGGKSDAAPSVYTFDMNLTKATGTIATSVTYNKTKYDFTSNEITVGLDLGGYLFQGIQGNVNNDPTMPLMNANILLALNFVYPYAKQVDPDNKNNTFTLDQFYPNKENQAVGGEPIDGVLYRPNTTVAPIVVGSYQIGQDYKVTTFTTDRTYQGTTGTTYTVMGQPASATSKTIFYRVILDIAKNKASVVMYKAKFSNVAAEPEKAVIYIPGLDLVWGNSTYTVSGKDIVPMVIDGGKLEEMPDFTFASFNMQTKGEFMTDVDMSFKVINSVMGQNIEYNGNFSGSSVTIPTALK